jgi:hypothetical protein
LHVGEALITASSAAQIGVDDDVPPMVIQPSGVWGLSNSVL